MMRQLTGNDFTVHNSLQCVYLDCSRPKIQACFFFFLLKSLVLFIVLISCDHMPVCVSVKSNVIKNTFINNMKTETRESPTLNELYCPAPALLLIGCRFTVYC